MEWGGGGVEGSGVEGRRGRKGGGDAGLSSLESPVVAGSPGGTDLRRQTRRPAQTSGNIAPKYTENK